MIKCEICDQEFQNNKAGQLTKHLGEDHDMSLEDYVILTEYGEEPRCECGYCEERPSFYRGSFRKHASGHRSFEWKEEQYIRVNGVPKCKECGETVEFRRGEPLQYCSSTCSGLNAGFSLEKTQEKIREVVQERYGVDNVSKLDFVKSKISEFQAGRIRLPISEDTRKNHSRASKKMWKDPEYRKKVTDALTAKWQDPEYREKMLDKMAQFPNRMSGLHVEIREYLDLDSLGFVSEQRIGRFIVDELHEEAKIVIEINGDYVHANPEQYDADDVINLRGRNNQYTAEEKWNSDRIRKEKLEDRGYKVVVIWESDDLDDIDLDKLYE